jgi:hypothetical protein
LGIVRCVYKLDWNLHRNLDYGNFYTFYCSMGNAGMQRGLASWASSSFFWKEVLIRPKKIFFYILHDPPDEGGKSLSKPWTWRIFHHLSTSRPLLIRSLIRNLVSLFRKCQWNLKNSPKPTEEQKSIKARPRYATFLVTTPINSKFSMFLKSVFFHRFG